MREKFMIIGYYNNDTECYFRDTYNDAENLRMNIVCGLGGDAEVWEYNSDTCEYEFLYS